MDIYLCQSLQNWQKYKLSLSPKHRIDIYETQQSTDQLRRIHLETRD